jgi:Melibiase
VLLNTWEAAYFNVSHDIEMDIARKAVTAGIEILVSDDGSLATGITPSVGLATGIRTSQSYHGPQGAC